ncbi:hypothetical protein [Avibacterium paragallinarum]|uniref:Ribbon-helix-helix protein, CopG family n=1 Tax=Avibacterium paragallinarum TaxID=728 RepID=A0ABU7QIZ2_AVIPA|nr:hypothetical protein [Avibacterium paragallinarum]QZP14820.1 hypothetical protein K5O18_08275 [Avibacterium paragallinarum]WAL56619.1 hypothetical protein OY678_11915 [Avibacterium paragallinarum]WAL56753.1 hypothetical protein OY678_12695 [Avibacterium paragallinarum]WAM59265.1 hypothetical protein OW731_12345 [Avibacterium paragallinarum]
MNKRKIFGVMLNDEERQSVKQLANQEHRSESATARLLILEAIEARKKKETPQTTL